MKIIVMNCNTTRSMTEAMGQAAAGAASDGTEIIAMQPSWGPDSAEGYYDSFITAAAVLDRLSTLEHDVDAVVMAGFGEHGREGARELLSIPVVDVTEAGAHLAMLLGRRFGIVTTLSRAIPQIEDSLKTAELLGACAVIEAAELGVLQIDEDRAATLEALGRAAHRARERGAEVIVLGCAGMTDLRTALELKLGVPVIDAVEAAVRLAEACVALELRTSKVGAYADPRTKARIGWPITATQR